MFCKSLTMHPHLHKLWLAFSCVLWPGSKSTSCDDAGGPSVRKVARWCCSTMHYIEWCCKSLSWTLNIGTCNTACTCSCISLLQQLLTSLNSFEPLLSRRLFMKTCQICWDITCDGIEELHSRWTRFNLIELNTTGNCSVTLSALKRPSILQKFVAFRGRINEHVPLSLHFKSSRRWDVEMMRHVTHEIGWTARYGQDQQTHHSKLQDWFGLTNQAIQATCWYIVSWMIDVRLIQMQSNDFNWFQIS